MRERTKVGAPGSWREDVAVGGPDVRWPSDRRAIRPGYDSATTKGQEPAMNAPAQPNDRQELHNASVDEEVAKGGGCGQIHLATGLTCTLEQRHGGSCRFVST